MSNGQQATTTAPPVASVQENVSPQLRVVLDAYGWKNKAEMKASPEYQAALKQGNGSPSEAFRILTESEQDIRGFFQQHGVGWKRRGRKSYREGFQSKFLSEDGRIVTIPHDDDRTGQFRPMERVVGGPFKVRLNLRDPGGPAIVERIEGKEPTLRAEEHDAEVPAIRADNIIERANEKGKPSDDWQKGCIKQKSRGLVTGTIGGTDSVFVVFEEESDFADFDHVAVITNDEPIALEDGSLHMNTWKTKVPAPVLKEQLGIDIYDFETDDIKEMLAGRAVIQYGELGVTNPVEFSEADVEELKSLTGKKSDEKAESLFFGSNTPQALKELQGLYDQQKLSVDEKGVARLDLRHVPEDHVVIAGHRIYGIERSPEGLWKLSMHCDDLDRPYWFNVRERVSTKVIKDDHGNEVEETKTYNEGAFIMFVDAIDGAVQAQTVYDDLASELA